MAGLLLDLGLTVRLRVWVAARLNVHRAAGVPTAHDALEHVIDFITASATNPAEPARAGLLGRVVFDLRVSRFAWAGPTEFRTDVALDDADKQALVESLADLAWATRHRQRTRSGGFVKTTPRRDRMATQAPQRGLFYTRDGGGEHENAAGEYVRWAVRQASTDGVRFAGTPNRLERTSRTGVSSEGDVFVGYGVKGNLLTRRGLDAVLRTAATEAAVPHVFIPRRDRLARLDDPVDGVQIEVRFRQRGVTLVYMDLVPAPLGRGRRDMGERIVGRRAFDKAGKERRDLAAGLLYAQLKFARGGFSTDGRAPYGFCRCQLTADGTKGRPLEDGDRGGGRATPPRRVAADRGRTGVGHHPQDPGPVGDDPGFPGRRAARWRGVPAPHAGQERTDRGVWHQLTVANIARNPLPRAVAEYGRRSMGVVPRFTSVRPREPTDDDPRADGNPMWSRTPWPTGSPPRRGLPHRSIQGRWSG